MAQLHSISAAGQSCLGVWLHANRHHPIFSVLHLALQYKCMECHQNVTECIR